MGYLSSKPDSNEPQPQSGAKSRWLEENELVDEFALLLSGSAKRCKKCAKAVRVYYLEGDLCPDCYQKEHNAESPALKRFRDEQRRAHTGGGACGEAGEAD